MFCLDSTDALEAWSDTNAKVDYSIHGLVGTTFTNLATGTLSNGANTVVYTAGAAISVVSATFVNTHSSAVTVNFKLDPANGGNDKFLLPVAVSLEPGNALVFDGQRFSVMDTDGNILTGGGGITLPLSVANGGTGLTSYAVGDLIYASGATTLSKLADVAVGQVPISGGVGVAPAWSASPIVTTIKCTALTDGLIPYHVDDATGLADSGIFWDGTNIGIGTMSPDDLLHLLKTGSDGARFLFEAYVSTDEVNQGGNIEMRKARGTLGSPLQVLSGDRIGGGLFWAGYYTGQASWSNQVAMFAVAEENFDGSNRGASLIFATTAAGGTSRTTKLTIKGDGIVLMPAVYGHDMNGETIRDLQINNSGELGYDSSTIRKKINITDMEDTSWVYDLRPVNYECKQKNERHIYSEEGTGKKEYGLIAEEVEVLCPEMVFHDVIHEEVKDKNGEVKERVAVGEQVEGIHRSKLIFPILNELQKLRARVEELENG